MAKIGIVFLCFNSEADDIDCSDGAFCVAFAAARAFCVINLCTEAVNRYCPRFADLNALHAADTARLAFLAGNCALVMVLAKHRRPCFFKRHKLNKTLGAGSDAFFARLAFKRIDSRNAVANADCIEITGGNAVAEA